MPRPALPSDTAAAAVRQHFGLSQQELAAWLGLSEASAGHLETGRRGLSPATAEVLAPLLRQLPAPGPAAGPALRLASAA
ncbi:helix-turn-helix transcriptional regulator, partial [Hymenobacter sp. ASUV-10]